MALDEKSFNVIAKFKVDPRDFVKLINNIKDFLTKELGPYPGFVSVKLHANNERDTLLYYATWESQSAYHDFKEAVLINSQLALELLTYKPDITEVHEILI